MYEPKPRFDEKRAYACRCPSCKRFMNVSGTALNEDKYIICWNCKAIGKTKRWIEGGQLCQSQMKKS